MGGCVGKQKGSSSPKQNGKSKAKSEGAASSGHRAGGDKVNEKEINVKVEEKISAGQDISSANVEDIYNVGEELGRGAFSVVRRGIRKGTTEKVALKFIEKKFVKKKHIEQLRREIDIMQKVNHTNVLALKGIHENDTHLTLVMELVDGGELFYKIVDRGSFTEKDARNVVRQVCRGVAYLHSMGIAHRDLKT